MDDVTVYSYDSEMKSTAPCPDWLNTTAGQEHWKRITFLSHHNRAHMAEALETTISQYNRSGNTQVTETRIQSSYCVFWEKLDFHGG